MFEELRERILNIFTSRLTILVIVFWGLAGFLIYRCFDLQIIQGQTYLDNFMLEQEKTREIAATRGKIFDRNGNLLAYNELAYSVKIEDTFESSSTKNMELNSCLFTLIGLIEKNRDHIISDFKIYLDEDDQFQFSVEGTSKLRFLADIYGRTTIDKLKDEEKTSSALDIMEYLSRTSGTGFHYAIGEYEIPGDRTSKWLPGCGYTYDEWLKLVTLRYAMSQTAYQKYIGTTIATDVCNETVAVILENSDILPGVTIEEDTIRRYVDSKYFSHILGYTGKISSEEITALNEQVENVTGRIGNYSAGDYVGKSGIESYMETTLQGSKGFEKVMVNNTGKVISVLDRRESFSGDDVYLSIDKDFTIAAYNIVEQKLAGLVSSKIVNQKEYNATKSSDIRIPIYDVYYTLIGNNVIDIHHLSESNNPTENKVFERYLNYKASIYDRLENELRHNRTIYSELDKEMQVYQSSIISLLNRNGVIMSEKIPADDEHYLAWTTEESISMFEYLSYCISNNWIDNGKLALNDKYSDSNESYDALISYIFEVIEKNTDFQKRFFKYMLLNDVIDGKDICMLLYEQDACDIPMDELDNLKNGVLTPYKFIMNRITDIDITPAQLALDPCNASVVITDVNTGQVLAMVSYPGYDNNKMANSVDAEYYEGLISDKSSPILNYATQYKAAPGSTFKIVSATAGLMENAIDLSSTIDCVSLYTSVTPSPRCWSYYGHSFENVTTAIRDSCNYFFYEVGFRLSDDNGYYNDSKGIEILAKYAAEYGLAEKSGVEISEYEPGVSDTDAVRSAIGQGTNSYTTASLARYATTIATDGNVFQLTLLDHVTDSDGDVLIDYQPELLNHIELPDSYWKAIHSGMRGVVENKAYFGDLAVNVAGKTGTAEQTKSRPNHALFICYAPYEEPEIAMATRIPFGYSSDYAAQVARDIIKYYYGLAEEDLINGKADTPDAGVTNEM